MESAAIALRKYGKKLRIADAVRKWQKRGALGYTNSKNEKHIHFVR